MAGGVRLSSSGKVEERDKAWRLLVTRVLQADYHNHGGEERPSKKPRLSEDDHVDELVAKETLNALNRHEGNEDNDAVIDPQSDQIDGLDPMEDDVEDQVTSTHEAHDSAPTQPAHETRLPPPDQTAPLVDTPNGSSETPPMSKSQRKKLMKKQEWESKRGERKLVRKEKVVAKRERRKAERQQETEANGGVPLPPPVKKPKAQKPVTLPVTILIDCDFDDLMRDNERISLAAQITRSYSDNKNAMFRAHLAVCSFGGKLRERFDTILTHYKSWRAVRFLDCDFVSAAEKAQKWMLDPEQGGILAGTFSPFASGGEEAKLKQESETVYLTSEAEETLTELKPYSTYIIGGLVDKNREKGICYKRARQRGVKTAKLPIGEFMEMQSRKVLATNHVNEIMLKWLECGDWGQAFMKVIPKRKGGKLKGEAESDGGEERAEVGMQEDGDDGGGGGGDVKLDVDGASRPTE
ncbi:tRNA (guanine(9)-N(1))-methyltransferase [Vermiconidia calcicola]|uniref:tRNA (Guanine(9)-N(1))-methyltransferase n=1 Tax=Vermiconidia calcicola TaxID=1690605 RepID=A0ACC3MFM1_9PEZI|nr:tRNA (guanine(9)-N(1))-methyltransferase [Vermiconidia calcicola]